MKIKHNHHLNILYAIIFILLILQLTSFLVLSSQVSKTFSELEFTKKNITNHLNQKIEEERTLSQQSVNEISLAIAQQQIDINKEISLLQATQEDFSGIIEQSIKGVVSIATERSMGTGFIVSPDGYIVTNQHVVAGSFQINVLTSDKNIYPAQVIGQDSFRDLALLKIPGVFNHLELSNKDQILAGKKVIAIGNPLGLSFTVTQGIISAVDRKGPNGLNEYVQTDVSLNPGNSGGPLIDTQGKVVGVNNFKISNSEGIGFALESSSIKQTINSFSNETIIG